MPKILRYAGFAEEATYNPVTPPAADFHVDISSSSLDAATDTELEYGGGLGRSIRTHRPGFYSPSGNIAYAADIRTIASFLKWTLGGYEFTPTGGSGSLNLHEFFGTDDRLLDSFTARLGKDVFEHVFTGCVVNSMQLSVSDQYAEATIDMVAAKDYTATLQDPNSLLLPDEYPLSFPDVTTTIAASDVSAKVRSLTLDISNSADSSQGRGLGSRYPRRIPVSERTTTVDMSLWFDDITELQRFWGGSTGTNTAGVSETPITITLDAGDDGIALITLPRVVYTSVQQTGSGRTEIEQSISGRAYVDVVTLDDGVTEVQSEIVVAVENDEDEIGGGS